MASRLGNGRAHVLEISNRAAVQKLNLEDIAGITASLDNHYSGLNTNAHQISNIAGLQDELDNKESTFSKNTGFNKNFGSTSDTVCEGDDARLSDARTPTAHSHAISDVSGLQDILDSGYSGSINVVTSVNFAGSSVTTKTITISNGIVISVV